MTAEDVEKELEQMPPEEYIAFMEEIKEYEKEHGTIEVTEENFGELLLKSAQEALEHVQGKRKLRTTYRESNELQEKRKSRLGRKKRS